MKKGSTNKKIIRFRQPWQHFAWISRWAESLFTVNDRLTHLRQGRTDTKEHTHKHLACSCVDNTYGIHRSHKTVPGESAHSDSFSNNVTSVLSGPQILPRQSLKMNSSSCYLAQKTDYISPNRHQWLPPTYRRCIREEGFCSDTE